MSFKSFKAFNENFSFINEVKQKQLTHLYHIEELVFFQGIKGGMSAIKAFNNLIEVVNKHKSLTTFAKVDGAPSIVAGWDPESGEFFVGSKSLFNKEPKINYTHADVDKNHGHAAGLSKKLKD